MKKLMFLLSGLVLWSSGILRAEEKENKDAKENTFSMNIQIRPRAEYRNGVLFPRNKGDEATGFINNRARLTMNYGRDNLSIGLSAQHVGVWGQDPQIDKNGRFILNEAWAQLDFGHGFFAKLGRQSLVYDDERILGALDWNVAGRYHDALKLGYRDDANQLDLILSFNQNDEKTIGGTYYAPGAQPYKTMQTLWYQHTFSPDFRASFLFMNLGIEPEDPETKKADTKYMQTLGTNLYYLPGNWTFGGTFYYQFGKTVANRDISAFMWAVNAAYQIDPRWKIGIGSDYLSGAGNDPDGKYKAFDPLYGTHHKFYGAMDYFYASKFIDKNTNPGLWDNQLSVAYKPSKKVNLSLAYHYFSITGDVYDSNKTKASRGLGSELDFQVDWQIMKDVKLSAGYSTMLAGETMELVKGGHPSSWQDWGWLSLNINPRVFMTKW
ncbi:alginate export family protein [uncultured Parabacteroides sp.]|uniref:alginate export family protein n=1 Tax=uncultured Parabacteroides sp. TaxID=512312 RepID=UPI00261D1833|nr:alginate export family protein [uncultured Parabacteroides sp.]